MHVVIVWEEAASAREELLWFPLCVSESQCFSEKFKTEGRKQETVGLDRHKLWKDTPSIKRVKRKGWQASSATLKGVPGEDDVNERFKETCGSLGVKKVK